MTIHFSHSITNYIGGLQNMTSACSTANVQCSGYPGQVTCPDCIEILKAWGLR
jgi:hypothetical protein